MNSLYLINETYSNGYNRIVLDLFFLISIFCGIFVIISKNPIVSVLFLIGLFLSIAANLMYIGITYIGLSYLLVYVGAVSILFLFILMLINVRISELLSNTSNSIPLAIIIGIYFNYPLYQILPYNINNFTNIFNQSYLSSSINGNLDKFSNFINSKDKIVFVTSNYWDANLTEISHITSIGNVLYTSHSMWLIETSIIILLAMVGAIVITIKQKKQITLG